MLRDGPDGDDRSVDRGQSSPVAFVLVIAIVIAGMSAVVLVGATMLDGSQTEAELQRAEHTMTLFDSRAAMVALGSSDVQRVAFALNGGSVESESGVGSLRITHVNYSDDGTREVETVYDRTLGVVRYENGGTRIAYQGGGVWRLDDDGNARMISPPEFHFRESTMTLPIVRITNDVAGGGQVALSVSASTQAREVFPDATNGTADGPGAPYDEDGFRRDAAYLNPVENGSVYLWVESDYYQAWAEYFRDRTSGNVTTWDSNQTVRLNLATLRGPPGNFEVPEPANNGGGAVEAGGRPAGHAIDEFSVSLKTNNNLNNNHWSLWSDSGSNELEIHLNMLDNCGGGGYTGMTELQIYYRNTSTGVQEEWYGKIPETDTVAYDSAVDVTCSGGPGDSEVSIDFQNTDSDLEYQNFDISGTTNKWHFAAHADQSADATTQLTQHSADPGAGTTFDAADDDPTSPPTVDERSVAFLTDHYVSRLPQRFEFRVTSGPGGSNRIDEGASTGVLTYPRATSSRYITYLHVTENELEISAD